MDDSSWDADHPHDPPGLSSTTDEEAEDADAGSGRLSLQTDSCAGSGETAAGAMGSPGRSGSSSALTGSSWCEGADETAGEADDFADFFGFADDVDFLQQLAGQGDFVVHLLHGGGLDGKVFADFVGGDVVGGGDGAKQAADGKG